MNTVVTSKAAILQTSRTLIQAQGWSAVNIRSVAKACGISVGSVYNYFDSKAALIAATVESIWCDIFHLPEGQEPFDCFTDCIEWTFACMRRGNEMYPGFFSMHSMSFVGEEKASGQKRMEHLWKHMQEGLYTALMRDGKVNKAVFDAVFTPEKFVELIFSFILAALLRQDYDAAGILGMAERILYR